MLPPAPLLSISRPRLGVRLSGPERLRTLLPWLVLHPVTPSSASPPLGLFPLTGASSVPDQLPPEPKSSVQMVHLLCWRKAPEPGTASGRGSMGLGAIWLRNVGLGGWKPGLQTPRAPESPLRGDCCLPAGPKVSQRLFCPGAGEEGESPGPRGERVPGAADVGQGMGCEQGQARHRSPGEGVRGVAGSRSRPDLIKS